MNNEFTHLFRSFLRVFSKQGFNELIDWLTAPSASSSFSYQTTTIVSQFPASSSPVAVDLRNRARRFQMPSIRQSFAQFLLSSIIGVAVAFTTVLPFMSPQGMHGDSPFKAALIGTCCLTPPLHFFLMLNGVDHELNPARCAAAGSLDLKFLVSGISRMTKSMASSFFWAPPLVSTIMSFWVTDDNDWSDLFSILTTTLTSSFLLMLYLQLVAEFNKMALCTPDVRDLKKIIDDISEDDTMTSYLDVAMFSILHSNADLVKQVYRPLDASGYVKFEAEEKKRNIQSIATLADILLYNKSGHTGAPLEEDILRLAILESLGGYSRAGATTAGLENASLRHAETVEGWMKTSIRANVKGFKGEPEAIPLLRSLCAYIGGLGEALHIIASAKKTEEVQEWKIPPGLISCAEYSLNAASRLIVWNFSHSKAALADWRSTHLSMLIPVLFESTFRLESGIVEYAHRRSGGKLSSLPVENKLRLIKTESHELLSLFAACSRTSLLILEKVQVLEGRDRRLRLDFDLNDECSKWVRELQARTEMPNNPPPLISQ
jgi:hypothetical protein